MKELKVTDFLNSLPKGETIYYRSNPGNAGDALIASGAYKIFREAGISYELIDLNDFDSKNKIIFYAGGGNLTGIYTDARDFINKHHRHAKQIVLLPHTVTANEDLLAELGQNVVLFAREKITYEHLTKHCNGPMVFVDHDLAFNLDPIEILQTIPTTFFQALCGKIVCRLTGRANSNGIPSPKIMARNTIYELKRTLRPFANKHAMFFRTDIEAASGPSAEVHDDLSRIYEYGTSHESLTNYTCNRLFKFINRFDTVSTDRLHICVAAALLGKKVYFHPNSYFKCKAVYDYSIASSYENVEWSAHER